MRITNYTISQQLLSQLSKTQRSLFDSYNELATGKKISRSSDDPAEASTVLRQTGELRKNKQYISNLQRADQVSNATYANVRSLKDLVTRASELGTSITGTTDPLGFQAKRQELNEIIEQALTLGNAQQNGQYIFAGNKSNAPAFVATRNTAGQITSVSYDGSSNVASFEVNRGVNITPYSTVAQNNQLTGVINNLIALRDAVAAQDVAAVGTANGAVIANEDLVIGQMSDHAAVQSRIELIKNQITENNQATSDNIDSRIGVDIAQASVKYNSLQNSYQAAVSAGGRILNVSLLDYLR